MLLRDMSRLPLSAANEFVVVFGMVLEAAKASIPLDIDKNLLWICG
jgi:hypothetical protein